MVRSETKHLKSRSKSALRSSSWVVLRSDFSMLDVAFLSTPTIRESADPMLALAGSPRTSLSESHEFMFIFMTPGKMEVGCDG